MFKNLVSGEPNPLSGSGPTAKFLRLVIVYHSAKLSSYNVGVNLINYKSVQQMA